MSVIALWGAGAITDMSHPTLGRMNLEMSIGFEVFAIAAFVWASIDYNRFIKFWMLRPAPYTRRVTVIFRHCLPEHAGDGWRLVCRFRPDVASRRVDESKKANEADCALAIMENHSEPGQLV